MVVMETYQKISQGLNKVLSKTLGYNNIVSGIVYFLILLYISMLTPDVPPVVEQLFNNSFFKVIVFTIIMWTANIDPVVAILISVAFLVTMNYVNNKPLWEFIDNVSEIPLTPQGNVSVPSNVVVPEQPESKKPVKQADEYTGCYQYKTYDITKVRPSSDDATNFSTLNSK